MSSVVGCLRLEASFPQILWFGGLRVLDRSLDIRFVANGREKEGHFSQAAIQVDVGTRHAEFECERHFPEDNKALNQGLAGPH